MGEQGQMRSITYFPAFPNGELELEYLLHIHPQQAHNDKIMCLFGALMFSLVVRKGWASDMPLQAAYGLLTVMLFLMPLVTMMSNRHGSFQLRNTMIVFMILTVWYYGLQASIVLSEQPVSPRVLPLVMLLRSQVTILFWVSLSLRLPFRLHAFTHLAGLLVVFGSNAKRCRWAIGQHPLAWLNDFVATMRYATRLRVPPPDSFTASRLGTCTMVSNFLQITLGYLLPTYIALLLELKSRHAFLRQRLHWRRMQLLRQGANPNMVPQISPWRPGRLMGPHMMLLAAALLLLSWWLSETVAEQFQAAQTAHAC